MWRFVPPLQILDIGNGCEAFSPTIYIPAKSELTAMLQSVTRSMFFLNYNTKYSNISQYLVWIKISSAQLTPEESAQLKSKLQLMPAMPMNEFEKELELINTNYPFSVPTGLLLIYSNHCWIIPFGYNYYSGSGFIASIGHKLVAYGIFLVKHLTCYDVTSHL